MKTNRKKPNVAELE